MSRIRCAIYTRKSTDEGLDQAFNSLDAQREACEAYIASQRHEGWRVMRERYDDGGLSGGTLERPALRRLFDEIDAGRVDMVVVYKIDRLTRSLSDFAKLVDRLDAARASFVSVTQQFNTSTSMGRLTLNVLLSFAQFEREVTAERIRDKIAASKKKGLWMGGLVPLGYDKTDKGLVPNEAEAGTVRQLFQAYLDLGCVRRLKAFADEYGLRSKSRALAGGEVEPGTAFSRGRLYHLLANPLYRGKIRHRDEVYNGQHDAIIDESLWTAVQDRLAANRVQRKTRTNAAFPSPLAGKLFDTAGARLTPSHANKSGRRYRYYVSKDGSQRLPAKELEAAVRSALETDRDLGLHLQQTGQASTDRLSLVERVTIGTDTIEIRLGDAAKGSKTVVPFSMQRRGVEQRLVLANQQPREPDHVLIGRVLQAMDWVDDIKSGASITEVAAKANVTPEYITYNLDLALLSPKILTAIASGTLAPHLSAKALTRMQIPVDWTEQEQLFLSENAVP